MVGSFGSSQGIAEFNRATLRQLRIDLQKVLDNFDPSVEFQIGNMSFTSTTVSMKIEAKIAGAVTPKDSMLDMMIASNKLVKSKNGAELVEYNARRHKYPYTYTKAGKRWKASQSIVNMMFAA